MITDSQVFADVDKIVPENLLLTSFSILFARYKGDLGQTCRGVKALKTLEDGDRILISEGCTHHRQCGDIGTEKLPAWIREFTGKEPEFGIYIRHGISGGFIRVPSDHPLRRAVC